MNKFVFTAILICFMGASFGQKATRKIDKVKFIKVIRIDFYLTTTASIDCDEFDKFKGWYSPDTIIFHNAPEQKKIHDYLNDSKEALFNSVDTRAKMFIHYESGKIDTLCLGSTIAFYYNGQRRLLKNRDLIEYIINLKKEK